MPGIIGYSGPEIKQVLKNPQAWVAAAAGISLATV
jgi:hypothetical protein